MTDNNPLTYVLSTAKIDATGQRWVLALSQFNFDIRYRAGIRSSDVDGLSRYLFEKIDTADAEDSKFDNSTVKAICSVMQPTYCFALPEASLDLVEVIDSQGQVIAQRIWLRTEPCSVNTPLLIDDGACFWIRKYLLPYFRTITWL